MVLRFLSFHCFSIDCFDGFPRLRYSRRRQRHADASDISHIISRAYADAFHFSAIFAIIRASAADDYFFTADARAMMPLRRFHWLKRQSLLSFRYIIRRRYCRHYCRHIDSHFATTPAAIRHFRQLIFSPYASHYYYYFDITP
jgi:hypothetical protein